MLRQASLVLVKHHSTLSTILNLVKLTSEFVCACRRVLVCVRIARFIVERIKGIDDSCLRMRPCMISVALSSV